MSAAHAIRAKAEKHARKLPRGWYSGRGPTRASLRKRTAFRGRQYEAGQPRVRVYSNGLLSVLTPLMTTYHEIAKP